MKKTILTDNAFFITDASPEEAKNEAPDGWKILAIFEQGAGKIGYAIFDPAHFLPMHDSRDREILGEKFLKLYEEALQ